MHKYLFLIQKSVAVFAFGDFAACYFFLADNRKFHSALRTSVVFDRADNREYSLATFHFVTLHNLGVYVLRSFFEFGFYRLHFIELDFLVFRVRRGIFCVLFLNGNGFLF